MFASSTTVCPPFAPSPIPRNEAEPDDGAEALMAAVESDFRRGSRIVRMDVRTRYRKHRMLGPQVCSSSPARRPSGECFTVTPSAPDLLYVFSGPGRLPHGRSSPGHLGRQRGRDGVVGVRRGERDLGAPAVQALLQRQPQSRRIASESRSTKLGLPEVQLGLLPGAGGTQRLPRLVGVTAALDLLLTGKQLNGKRAKRIGLVDEVVPPSILLDVAIKKALKLADAPKPQLTDRVKELFSKDSLQELALEGNPIGRAVVFSAAGKTVHSKTLGNYPAPEKILEVVKTGLADGPEAGYEAEAPGVRRAGRQRRGPATHGHLLRDDGLEEGHRHRRPRRQGPHHREGRHARRRPDGQRDRLRHRGARRMFPVRLKDISHEGVGRGLGGRAQVAGRTRKAPSHDQASSATRS